MKCVLCGKEHDGTYGSGRFCSSHCARSFSTKNNREEINKKVSTTLKQNFKNTVGKTKREIEQEHRLQNQIQIMNIVQEWINSDNYRYVKYDNIDFGTNYLVSRDGKVYSAITLKELCHSAYNEDKYRRILLVDTTGGKHLLYLHRVVAMTFIPNPHHLPIINHKDENPQNNSVTNLEWCTVQYNNTYNNAHIKRGKTISETIRYKGGAWNKGKKMKSFR